MWLKVAIFSVEYLVKRQLLYWFSTLCASEKLTIDRSSVVALYVLPWWIISGLGCRTHLALQRLCWPRKPYEVWQLGGSIIRWWPTHRPTVSPTLSSQYGFSDSRPVNWLWHAINRVSAAVFSLAVSWINVCKRWGYVECSRYTNRHNRFHQRLPVT